MFFLASGKDEDPSVVMGNTNATVHTTARKSTDQTETEGFTQRIVSGAVVIERKNSNKNTKTKTKSPTSNERKPSVVKSIKELQQQVDNLQNQLKERENRIKELETSIENHNDTFKNEKIEFEKVKIEFDRESLSNKETLKDQEVKLDIASKNLQNTNTGLEALAIVIKYYLSQVNIR